MEKTFDRAAVLRKTHWGVDIYAHILRRFYPGETVMKVTGRDCGIIRNPFAGGVQSLRVRFTKNDPDALLSDETAYHHDENGAIPDGDALDFAGLYYRQSGQELLDTLNREMHLRLDADTSRHTCHPTGHVDKGPKFSFFKAPVTNKFPFRSITVLDAYNYIAGPYAQRQTQELRAIPDKKKASLYKQSRFAYVTFCGEFDVRSNDGVKSVSNLLCLDFDHLKDVDALKRQLLQDSCFATALAFRSPSGDGLKWVIEIDRGDFPLSDFFRAVANYITETYGIEPDKSGKDIARACFLPHDPEAYVNPLFV